MQDRKDERHPFYPDSRTNASHSGRTGDSRVRLSGAISPPPLKRQRTVSDHPKSHPRNPSTDSSAHTASLRKERSGGEHGIDPSRKSYSFPAPSGPSGHEQRQSNGTSLNRKVRRSDVSAEAVCSSKRACRVCERSSSTTYNPLIVCGGCARSYHDSCRKPSLTKGADPQQWRCTACLNGKGAPKGFRIPTGLAPTKHSAVRDIFRPNARKSLNLVPPDSPKEAPRANDVSVQAHVRNSNEAVQDKRQFEISESEKIQDLPEQPTVQLSERTEIVSTPTQHSSQIEFPDNHGRNRVQHVVQHSVDNSALDAQSQSPKPILNSLCSMCREHGVFIRNANDAAECPSCHDRSLITESRRLEISETPDILPIRNAQTHAEVTHSVAPISSCEPTATPAPTFGVHADLIASVPDAEKTNDDQISYRATGTHEASTKPEPPTEVPQIDDVTEQNIVHEARRMEQPKTSAANHEEERMSEAAAETSFSSKESGHPEVALPARQETNDLASSRISTEISPSIEIDNSTVNAPETGQPSPSSIDPMGLNDQFAQSLTNPEDSANSPLERTASPEKRYTTRELARIALVGANGTSLTTLQIIDWLAQSFSYLQKGEGAWEKSVKSALSGFKEFNGKKAIGTSKLYSFASEQIRVQFEQEYQAYCTNPESAAHPPVEISEQEQQERIIQPTHTPEQAAKHLEADHVASSRKTIVSNSTKPDAPSIPAPIPKLIETSLNNDPFFMPFERTKTARPENGLEDATDTKRETSFHAIRLEFQKQSIETMTTDEKVRKIAQIQERPSRKKFFGADHRLAHVRRYKRQDVHDERDGAWQLSMTDRKKTKRAVDHHIGDTRTLREVFNLPANAIPMNDGQHELAFRDGTLMKGRLPRSRNVYRVGKLFGGELTTRLS